MQMTPRQRRTTQQLDLKSSTQQHEYRNLSVLKCELHETVYRMQTLVHTDRHCTIGIGGCFALQYPWAKACQMM